MTKASVALLFAGGLVFDATLTHRCPGESLTIALIVEAVRMFAADLVYQLPMQRPHLARTSSCRTRRLDFAFSLATCSGSTSASFIPRIWAAH